MMNTLVGSNKIHTHSQENFCSHTFVWTIFCSHVAVKDFEEIKWSLSKVVWTPVNHCWIANKINWNNRNCLLKKYNYNWPFPPQPTLFAAALHHQVIAVIQFTWWPRLKEATSKVIYPPGASSLTVYVLGSDCPQFSSVRFNAAAHVTVKFEDILSCRTKVS